MNATARLSSRVEVILLVFLLVTILTGPGRSAVLHEPHAAQAADLDGALRANDLVQARALVPVNWAAAEQLFVSYLEHAFIRPDVIPSQPDARTLAGRWAEVHFRIVEYDFARAVVLALDTADATKRSELISAVRDLFSALEGRRTLVSSPTFNDEGLPIFKRLFEIADRFQALSCPRGELFALFCMADIRSPIPRAEKVALQLGDDLSLLLVRGGSAGGEPPSESVVTLAERLGLLKIQVGFLEGLGRERLGSTKPADLEQAVTYLERAQTVARMIPARETVDYPWYTASAPEIALFLLPDLWSAYQKLQRFGQADAVLSEALDISRPFGERALTSTISGFARRASAFSWETAQPLIRASQNVGPRAELATMRSLAGFGSSFRLDVAEKALALALAIPDSHERAVTLEWYTRSRRMPPGATGQKPTAGAPPAGQPQSAEPDAFPALYDQLFGLCVKAGEYRAAAEALAYRADRYGWSGSRAMALETFNQAIQMAERSGDQLEVARLANRAIGRNGRWTPAVQSDLATRAAGAARAADNPLELSKALVFRAQAAVGGTRQSLEDLLAAAAAAERYTGQTAQATQELDCLRLLAQERVRRGEYLAAVETQRRWAETARRFDPLSTWNREIGAYVAMADVYAKNLGEPSLALDAGDHARRLLEAALAEPGARAPDSVTWLPYLRLGQLAATLWRPVEAIDYWGAGLQRAAASFPAGSQGLQLARRLILTSRAELYERLGDYESALRDRDEVLALTHLTLKNYRLSPAAQKATGLSELAWTLALAGNLDKALATARQAAAELARDQSGTWAGPSIMSAGVDVQYVIDNPEETVAAVIGSVTDILLLSGNAEEGIAFCNLDSIRGALTDKPVAERIHLEHLARAYASAGQFDHGRAALMSAVEIDRTHATAEAGGLAGALLALGELELVAGDLAKAKEYLTAARAAGNPYDLEQIWRTELALARVQMRMGDAEAAQHFDAALTALESGREHVRPEEFRLRYGVDRNGIYEAAADLLAARALSSGRPVDATRAFEGAERKRTQVLWDLLAAGWSRVPPTALPDQLRRTLDLESRIDAKRRLLQAEFSLPSGKRNGAMVKALENDLEQLQVDHTQLLTSVAQGQYRYAAHARLAASLARPVQTALGPSRVLVEYLVTDQRSYAFVVSALGVKVVPLTTGRAALREQVQRVLAPFRQLRAGTVELTRLQYDLRAAHALYQAIFAPVQPFVGQATDIIIVPDDVLHFLPFDALVEKAPSEAGRGSQVHSEFMNQPFLLRRYTLSYLSSAAGVLPGGTAGGPRAVQKQLFAMVNPTAGRPMAAQADEDPLRRQLRLGSFDAFLTPLPGADSEVRRIAGYFPRNAVTIVQGSQATEAAYDSRAGQFTIVHFATHAVASDGHPLYSTLILAPGEAPGHDGFLQAYEVLRTPLKARLVVLSACETALGSQDWGQGLVGLAAAFEQAGAESVLATLWSIDESTSEVMTLFYRAMAQGSPTPAALHQAKLQLLQRRMRRGNVEISMAHPFFWAPFKLVGR